MDKTMAHVNQLVLGRTILDSIIRDVVNQRVDDYEKLEEALKQVKSLFYKNKMNCDFNVQMIAGGIEMGTSTGDAANGLEQNNERLESGADELSVGDENNTNDGGETRGSALQNGKFDD